MSQNVIRVAHVNVRSLSANFDSFRRVVLDNSYDVVGVSQTWLSRDVLSGNIFITGYNIVRCDRPTRGGGVALYIRDTIKYKCLHTSRSIEQLWICVDVHNKKYTIGVIYRSPSFN